MLTGRDCLGFADTNLQRDKAPAYDHYEKRIETANIYPKTKNTWRIWKWSRSSSRTALLVIIMGSVEAVGQSDGDVSREGSTHENDGGILPS